MKLRLESLPLLKVKIEEMLGNLVSADVDQIDWTVKEDIADRKIIVEILPVFKDVADPTKFGETGEKGSDILPTPPGKVIPVEDLEENKVTYPNLS